MSNGVKEQVNLQWSSILTGSLRFASVSSHFQSLLQLCIKRFVIFLDFHSTKQGRAALKHGIRNPESRIRKRKRKRKRKQTEDGIN